MPIDNIIAQMKNSDCMQCECENAIFDETGEEVSINGSFCNMIPGFNHIAIISYSKETGDEVWSRVCDTGKMCSIPFTSSKGFQCSK